jgi:hypothetical protein
LNLRFYALEFLRPQDAQRFRQDLLLQALRLLLLHWRKPVGP